MNKLTEIFLKLKSCDGTNAKIEFVKNHKDDVEFIESLKFLLDSSIVTGISDKKYNKYEMNDVFIQDECVSISTVFDYLKSHNTGKDEDIYRIKKYECIWCTCDEDRELFKGLVTKNLKTGLEVKNCNKAIPNLVPTWGCGLCDKYYGNEKVIDGKVEFLIDSKLDGVRCTVVKENGNVKLVSRSGKSWEGLIEIEKALKDLKEDNFAIDSEITIKNPQNYPSLEVYDRTIKIVTTKSEEKVGLQLNCFDYMTLEEWNNKESKFGCLDRKNQLYDIIKGNDILVFVENLYVGKDPNVIEEMMNGIVEDNDMEGLIVKLVDSQYEWKRTKNWLKVKKMQRSDSDGKEVDAVITGFYEGKNKNKGKLGGLYCTMEHPTYGHLEFKCGGGFSDYMREYLYSLGDKLIGRTISVQFFEPSKNSKTNVQSIRFPVFLELKEEGQEPNN